MIYHTEEELKLEITKQANPQKYNQLMCEKIQRDTKEINLPLFTVQETSHIKKHLIDYEKIPDKNKLHLKFLNLRNIFLIINTFETDPLITNKIRNILRYLKHYNYIFQLITESQHQNTPTLQKAIQFLNLEINTFTMRYNTLLNDPETRLDMNTPLTNQEPENGEEDEEEEEPIQLDDIPNHNTQQYDEEQEDLHQWQ